MGRLSHLGGVDPFRFRPICEFGMDDGRYTWFEPSWVEFFEEDDGTILWTLDDSRLLIATNTDVEFLSAYYYSEDYPNELASTLTCFMWPVVMVGGIIWGFATKRRSLPTA